MARHSFLHCGGLANPCGPSNGLHGGEAEVAVLVGGDSVEEPPCGPTRTRIQQQLRCQCECQHTVGHQCEREVRTNPCRAVHQHITVSITPPERAHTRSQSVNSSPTSHKEERTGQTVIISRRDVEKQRAQEAKPTWWRSRRAVGSASPPVVVNMCGNDGYVAPIGVDKFATKAGVQ